jgi:hypothetical protein
MKNRLIIHIGTHKTATTTLQNVMWRQREEIQKNGICYPDTSRPPRPRLHKHGSFSLALHAGGKAFEDEREAIMREFRASGAHTLILSSEALSEPLFQSKASLRPLKMFQDEFDIEVICVLRRQDYFVESLWNQRCKNGRTKDHIDSFVSIPSVVCHMSYVDTLDAWANYAQVTAISYHAEKSSGIVEALLEKAGIPIHLEKNLVFNRSPSMTCASITAGLHRKTGFLYDWRSVEDSLGEPVGRYALGANLRKALLDRFSDHNDRLASVYGVRFPCDLPDEPEGHIVAPNDEVLRKYSKLRVIRKVGERRRLDGSVKIRRNTTSLRLRGMNAHSVKIKARSLELDGSLVEALELYKSAGKRWPSNVSIKRGGGRVAFALGKYSLALKFFQSAQTLMPSDPNIAAQVFEMQIQTNLMDDARSTILQAMNAFPQNSRIQKLAHQNRELICAAPNSSSA